MKFFRFLISRTFWINVLVAVALVALLIFLFFQFLGGYTHHGESLTVPDLHGQSLEQMQRTLAERDLRYEIRDSVYVQGQPPLTVLDQNPRPSSKVKRGRTIYVTINTDDAPLVPLPNLMSQSLRQARQMLQAWGLEIDDTRTVPDPFPVVLGVEYKGRKLQADVDSVPKGSAVTLIMGDGNVSSQESLPNLVGMTVEELELVMRGWGLTLGDVHEMGFVPDRNQAMVVRQYPEPGPDVTIAPGEVIDVWVVSPEAFEERYQNQTQDDATNTEISNQSPR